MTTLQHQRGFGRSIRLGVVAVAAVLSSPRMGAGALISRADAYVTSYNILPAKRQREFLHQLTTEICQAEVGRLSSHQLSQTTEIMHAWSHLVIPPSGCSTKSHTTMNANPSQRRNHSSNHTKDRAAGDSLLVENAVSVERLLKRLIDEKRAGNPLLEDHELSADDYNCVLEAWARSKWGEAAASRCEQILSGMVENEPASPMPDLSSFKAALMAWRQASAKGGDVAGSGGLSSVAWYAPFRAQRILEWMIRLHDEGRVDYLPDSDCFDMVLQTWSRSGHRQAPQRSERLLGVMERLYERTGHESVKPRTLSFNAVLAAWSRSDDPVAADRSCDVLSFMELLDSKGDHGVAPDTVSFCTVMGSLAKSPDQASAAAKAEMFLHHVEEQYVMARLSSQSGKLPSSPSRSKLVPDTILYNTAMGCLAKGNISGAYLRARSILERQVQLYNDGCKSCRPDLYGFTSVIACCAAEPSRREKSNAFKVALDTFQTLQSLQEEGGGNIASGPNHVTYGAMLKAIAKLLPASSPLRQSWTRQIFQDCAARGYVGDMVLSRLREAACPDLYKELMQGNKRKELPSSWTRNVVEMNEYRKKKSRGQRSTTVTTVPLMSKPRRRRAEV